MLRASPFDALAADYDRSFTASAIGQRMRAAVWRRLDTAFAPGERVLELNCGTGEDAVHLAERGVRVLATDVSPGMLAMTRAKVERAGVADRVEVAELPIQDLARRPAGRFDGAYGVLAGAHACFRVAEALEGSTERTKLNIAVVNWFNEEGSRFKPSMMGSSVFTEKLPLDIALATTDRAGTTVSQAMPKALRRSDRCSRRVGSR